MKNFREIFSEIPKPQYGFLEIRHFEALSCLYLKVTSFTRIIYNKPTRCNSGNIVFINNYKYALHVSDALCAHHQEHYKL